MSFTQVFDADFGTAACASCVPPRCHTLWYPLWLLSTRAKPTHALMITRLIGDQTETQGVPMKKILVALVATLVAVSVAGCAGIGKGKGKAPPPIVTKG